MTANLNDEREKNVRRQYAEKVVEDLNDDCEEYNENHCITLTPFQYISDGYRQCIEFFKSVIWESEADEGPDWDDEVAFKTWLIEEADKVLSAVKALTLTPPP